MKDTTNSGSPITDEKRTLIDTDASHRRLTLMIFQIFHPCESVFIRERLSASPIYGTGTTGGSPPIPMKIDRPGWRVELSS